MRLFAPPAPGARPPGVDRLLLTACLVLTISSFGFLEPFVPLFLEQSGLRRGEIGLVSGFGAALALVIQPLLGRLTDRLDARRPVMFGAALAACGAYLLYQTAGGFWTFALLTAVGVNSILYLNTAYTVLINRVVRRDGQGGESAGAYAAIRTWGSVGYVVVSLATGLLMSRGAAGAEGVSRSAIAPLFTYGPLLFAGIAVLVLFLSDPKSGEIPARKEDPTVTTEEEASDPDVCDRNLRRFLRAYFLYAFAFTGGAAYLSLHLRSMGATPLWITFVFATGVLCEALLMPRAGRLSDRFGRRPLLALSFLLMPVRLLLYAVAGAPLWILMIQSLHGINFGIMGTVGVAFVNDLCSEENRGATQARMAGTGGLATALGPVTGGFLSQAVGLPWTFALMAVVAAWGAGLFLWKVGESHPKPAPLYPRGPAWLRPAVAALRVPIKRLRRNRPPGPAGQRH
jgi:PPP family 3-phenylpropionic acid transporter